MTRILIVEDFQLIRKGIRSNLEREKDLEVIGEVENSDDAVSKTLELKPDLVLMDLKLGDDEYGGINAARIIKEKQAGTKVLILSHYDDEERITRAIEARVDGYILKDVDQKELVKAIRTIMEGKAAIDPSIASKLIHRMAEKNQLQSKKQEIQYNISAREMEVFKLLTEGLSNRDIAGKLFISEATVKAHISSILRKLEVTDRVQAVIMALNLDLFK
jgi:DNA-binding NarL/FixJ family response regulator